MYKGLIKLKVKSRWRTCLHYDVHNGYAFYNNGVISLDKKWMRPCSSPSVSGTWQKLTYEPHTGLYVFPDPSGDKNFQVFEQLINMVDETVVELELLGITETIITLESV